MSEFIYQDLTPDRRVEMLAKNSLRNEIANYARTLGEDEMNAEKSAYAQLGINLEKLEAEKKAEMAKFASKIKEVKALMAAGIAIIKNGKRDVEGKLFYFADQIGGKMNAYDKNGELISSRNLSPDEKNTQLYIGDNTDQVAQGVPNGHDTEDAEHVEVPAKKETAKEKKARLKLEAQQQAAAVDTRDVPEANLSELEEKVQKMSSSRKKANKKVDEKQASEIAEDENNIDNSGDVNSDDDTDNYDLLYSDEIDGGDTDDLPE